MGGNNGQKAHDRNGDERGKARVRKVACRWLIDVVINMDMIGYKATGSASRVTVEYDQGNRNPGNDAAAKAFGLVMALAAKDYTSLDPVFTDIWSSDYIPFEAKGFAIGAYDADENPRTRTIIAPRTGSPRSTSTTSPRSSRW